MKKINRPTFAQNFKPCATTQTAVEWVNCACERANPGPPVLSTTDPHQKTLASDQSHKKCQGGMPRLPSPPDDYQRQILEDTEQNDLGIFHTDFRSLCNKKPHIYGKEGTETRHKYQRKRARLCELTPKSFRELFNHLDFPISYQTELVLKKREKDMAKKEMAKKKGSKSTDSSSVSSYKDDDSSISSAASTMAGTTKSAKSSKSGKKRRGTTHTPSASARKKSKTPPRQRSPARGHDARTPPREVFPEEALTLWDDDNIEPKAMEAPDGIDPEGPDGSFKRPFVIPVNLHKAYANREFHIQWVPQITVPGKKKRYRAAAHIRKKVPPLDINFWHAKLESNGSNVVHIKGPAHDTFDDDVNAYHRHLPHKCEDTKREHEKAKAQAFGNHLHYKLVFPRELKVDNFLCSADYTKIDAMRLIVSRSARENMGYVSWVAVFESNSDVGSKDTDDMVNIEDLFRNAAIADEM